MLEREIEAYFVQAVKKAGGKAWKFTSPAHRGVADRIACFPNGQTWFVELKTEKGMLSPLQQIFAREMSDLNQKYIVLRSRETIDKWIESYGLTKSAPSTSSIASTGE